MAKILLGSQVIVEFEGSGDIRHGKAPDGQPVYLNLEGIGSEFQIQTAVLQSEAFKGRQGLGRLTEGGLRRIELSNRTGVGAQVLPDGRSLTIQLDPESVPIRQVRRGPDGTRELWQNPRWRR